MIFGYMSMEIYVVQFGDTLDSIADQFGVSEQRLAYDNGIEGDMLVVGQALLILFPDVEYVVQNGDTLYSIAQQFQVSVLQLVQNNSFLLNEDFLLPGRTIVIRYRDQESRKIEISGYAYSYIQEEILQESSLYIDELLPFSYGFNEDGSLIPLNDERLLDTATRFGNRKRMVLTPLDRNERFNNQLVVALLSSDERREILIQNVIATMQQKGYSALDIDFEFIPGQFREAYVDFIRMMKEVLNEFDYNLSVAVPPKISDDQPGLLYEGIDYQGIGAVADYVFLMTYEWGYKYGPPLAVAPIPSVRRVLDYAVSVVLANKIILGIPNYAYDWPLPYVRNQTVAQTIGNMQAVNIARRNGAQIQYDENAMAPYFYYTENGVEHVVWFEDIRSIAAKFDLIEEYQFYGGGYWNLMREFRQNWMYVNQIHAEI